jgi:hypothetical protein
LRGATVGWRSISEVVAGVCPRVPAHVGVPVSISEIAAADYVAQLAFDACAFGADRDDEWLVQVLQVVGRRVSP